MFHSSAMCFSNLHSSRVSCREVQKLKLQCKQKADRVITCSEANKDEAKSLISIDTSQEGIEERLSWMSR